MKMLEATGGRKRKGVQIQHSAVAKAIEQKNLAKANCKMAIDKTCCSDDLS